MLSQVLTMVVPKFIMRRIGDGEGNFLKKETSLKWKGWGLVAISVTAGGLAAYTTYR